MEITRSLLGCREMLTSQGSIQPSITPLEIIHRVVKQPYTWGIPCVLQTRWVTSVSLSLGSWAKGASAGASWENPPGHRTADENGAFFHLERRQLAELLWVSSERGRISSPQQAPSLPKVGESTKKPARGLTALLEKCIPAALLKLQATAQLFAITNIFKEAFLGSNRTCLLQTQTFQKKKGGKEKRKGDLLLDLIFSIWISTTRTITK